MLLSNAGCGVSVGRFSSAVLRLCAACACSCAALVFITGCVGSGLPEGWECNDDDYPCKQGEVCRTIGTGDDANPRCWTTCETSASCADRDDAKTVCLENVCQAAATECVTANDCETPSACTVLQDATCIDGQCVYPPKECTDPPADECLESDTRFRDYAETGTCALADGECHYELEDVQCHACNPSIGCILQPKGDPCTATEQCESSLHCVDQVCCESSCDGECVACAESVTGVANGKCAPVPAGLDPHEDCEGTLACSDVAGECYRKELGEACTDGPTQCLSGFCYWDGSAGVCLAQAGASCELDTECTSGNCECGDSICAPDELKCSLVACAACQFTSAGITCDGLIDMNEPCDDGDICTVDESCDGSGGCGNGTTPERCMTPTSGNYPCYDGTDNDGDGLTDCDDPDCADAWIWHDSCCGCRCGDDFSECCC